MTTIYKLDEEETRQVFRTHFGGEPFFWRCRCGCENWLAYRAAKAPGAPPALWVQGCYAADASGKTQVLGLADETDLQDFLRQTRWTWVLKTPFPTAAAARVMEEQLTALAAVLRPHLPGEKAN